MTILVREAREADAAVVALLGRITFTETFGHLFRAHRGDLRIYLDVTFDVEKIRRSLNKQDNIYWLTLSDGLPVGYAKLKLRSVTPHLAEADAAQLQKIYVLRDFIGDGYGRALLQIALERAAGVPAIWLAVLRQNRRAIRFYGRQGFTARGDDTFVIGAQNFDFCLMARRP
ncbi:MAG TPA: GNAT family N-acetyltransferase [Acidiphilium sp.]